MANLSTYGANAILDGTAMPATLYAQQHTGNPTAAGTANVASETSRKSFTRTAASGGACSNAAVIEWLNDNGSGETITHITLWDASSAGNCWWVIAGTDPDPTVQDGETVQITPGDLDLSFPIWS
jgi:hypothetical protein